jgi:hypothetical protein
MRRAPSEEADRWFLQAERDLDDTRYSAAADAQMAISMAQQVLDTVSSRLRGVCAQRDRDVDSRL